MKRITLSIPDEIYEKFKEIAHSKGNLPLSSMFRLMIAEYRQPQIVPTKKQSAVTEKPIHKKRKTDQEPAPGNFICDICSKESTHINGIEYQKRVVAACDSCKEKYSII